MSVCLTGADFLAYRHSTVELDPCDATKLQYVQTAVFTFQHNSSRLLCPLFSCTTETYQTAVLTFQHNSSRLLCPLFSCTTETYQTMCCRQSCCQYRDKAKGWITDESEFDLQQRQTVCFLRGPQTSCDVRTHTHSIQRVPQTPLSGNTDMCRLTTGIRSEKCVVRQFRRCAKVIECTYTNLDSTV